MRGAGLTWDDLETVLGEAPDYHADGRSVTYPWAGPPGQAWRFWNLVWEMRRKRWGIRA